jgi:hypothetical protein
MWSIEQRWSLIQICGYTFIYLIFILTNENLWCDDAFIALATTSYLMKEMINFINGCQRIKCAKLIKASVHIFNDKSFV